jgi:hypothetical protein
MCSQQEDQTSITNTVHYLTTGSASLKFTAKEQDFFGSGYFAITCMSGSENGVASGGVTDEPMITNWLRLGM